MEALSYRFRIVLILWVATAVIYSTVYASEQQNSQVSEIIFERTTCFGSCPSYRVTIKKDGTVEYDGREFVAQKGLKTSEISHDDFVKLEKAIRAMNFFELDNQYTTQVVGGAVVAITDLPTEIVTVKSGDRVKRIEDYLGAPKQLKELEDMIDRVANSSAWTGYRPDPDFEEMPYYDSFPANRQLTFRGLICEMGKTPDGKPNYMLCLSKNTIQFDLHMPPGLDLSQFAEWVVDATGAIREDDGQFFEVSEMRRIRRSGDKTKSPNAQSKHQ